MQALVFYPWSWGEVLAQWHPYMFVGFSCMSFTTHKPSSLTALAVLTLQVAPRYRAAGPAVSETAVF
jgi:hypothetical protein